MWFKSFPIFNTWDFSNSCLDLLNFCTCLKIKHFSKRFVTTVFVVFNAVKCDSVGISGAIDKLNNQLKYLISSVEGKYQSLYLQLLLHQS